MLSILVTLISTERGYFSSTCIIGEHCEPDNTISLYNGLRRKTYYNLNFKT